MTSKRICLDLIKTGNGKWEVELKEGANKPAAVATTKPESANTPAAVANTPAAVANTPAPGSTTTKKRSRFSPLRLIRGNTYQTTAKPEGANTPAPGATTTKKRSRFSPLRLIRGNTYQTTAKSENTTQKKSTNWLGRKKGVKRDMLGRNITNGPKNWLGRTMRKHENNSPKYTKGEDASQSKFSRLKGMFSYGKKSASPLTQDNINHNKTALVGGKTYKTLKKRKYK
jgi:hypothetical protein